MTLIIANKIDNHISLSSDSRISFGTKGTYDYGVKVLSLPLKIYSPRCSETGKSTLDYHYDIGLAFAGSSTNAYTVKESVSEILQNLQYIPNNTVLSMESIAKLVFKVFNKLTLDIIQIMMKDGICGIILSGFCLEKKKIRVFKFSCNMETKPIEPKFEEILKNDGIEFFGTGETKALEIYNTMRNCNKFTPLHIVKEVIQSRSVDSVGGWIQYGEFKDDNFKIYGIEDYEIGDDGCPRRVQQLRGLNLYQDEFESENGDFHISYNFKMPFESEFQRLYNEYNNSKNPLPKP